MQRLFYFYYMAKSFLEDVLDDLQRKNINVVDCVFVLPSKRSRTFLKKYISTGLNKTVFSPKIWAIQEFVSEIAGIAPASNLDLLIELYGAYRKSAVSQPDDFSSFLKWGHTLLQDYNEIDSHLIPVNNVLNYISAIKELDHWSLIKEKTTLVNNYLQLWNNLETIYKELNIALLKKAKGYPGLIQRKAVEKLHQGKVREQNKRIIFIGFNALSTAESKIIQHFIAKENALVYWDIDCYFLNDPVHDAGLFIRKYQSEWPYNQKDNAINSNSHFLGPKKISITGIPKNIAQTKYVGKLLGEIQMKSADELKNTALVLADEQLLPAMLKAVPQNIQKVNITMGTHLTKTVLYSFFSNLLDLHINTTERGYFFKPVLEFLANPYCTALSGNHGQDFAQKLIDSIKLNNWILLSNQMLMDFDDKPEVFSKIFPEKPLSSQNWVDTCIILIAHLKDFFQKNSNPLELERLYRFHNLFNQLKQYSANMDFSPDLKSLKTLFRQLASLETLDFVGEPLEGLQLMGVLESRNLDFETVIITSVNEGILPSGKTPSSFIPFDVKRQYGLPTYKEKDAVFVYHFYRLLQRAKNIHITYNTEPDVLEGGEVSRLVSQLLSDTNLEPYITHSILSPKVKLQEAAPMQIEKNQGLMDDLKKFSAKGFSPSSLANYVKNPIDFYKRNLLKINDLEEVEESIAANTFGTVLHNTLEDLYAPLVGRTLTVELVNDLKPKIPVILKANFHKVLPGVDLTKGSYFLVYNVIERYIQNFIALEMTQIKQNTIKLVSLEEKYEMTLDIPELDFPVMLKGTVDRVDEFNGVTRVIDYKTGRVETKNVTIQDWEETILDYGKSKALQLLCYAYLYMDKHPVKEAQAGIYCFKTLGKGLLHFKQKRNAFIDGEALKMFETQLKKLVLEICDANKPLVEKED